MTADPADVERLTRLIRGCFNRLAAVASELHRDMEITAAMRAVIEALYDQDRQTVPQIARAKSVTRQHIQMLVNRLATEGYVEVMANPADRRSPLVVLTRSGRSAYERMRRREKKILTELAAVMGRCNLRESISTLEELQAYLDGKLSKGQLEL